MRPQAPLSSNPFSNSQHRCSICRQTAPRTLPTRAKIESCTTRNCHGTSPSKSQRNAQRQRLRSVGTRRGSHHTTTTSSTMRLNDSYRRLTSRHSPCCPSQARSTPSIGPGSSMRFRYSPFLQSCLGKYSQATSPSLTDPFAWRTYVDCGAKWPSHRLSSG